MNARGAKIRRGDAPIAVWSGSYRFGDDDSFFPAVVKFAREYADKKLERRPPEARFLEELESLRSIAPLAGQVLLDQIEHRWRHPLCLPSLYVLTCTLRAPARGSLVEDSANLAQEILCTKVGQARHTVAARMARYKTEVLGGVHIVEGSQNLRAVIFGDGPAMLLERDIKEVARNIGRRAEVADETGVRRRVGSETYVGVEIIDPICAFARQRCVASDTAR
jgi:hypothetical protein